MKHKVWSKKFNCWMDKDFFDKHYESGRVPDTFINSEGLLVFVYSGFSTHIVNPDEYVIVWSTGLSDRNGKEIYGGDILKYTSRERVGERRVTRKRGYDTYDVYGDVEIQGVVRFGTIKGPFIEGIPVYYVDTDMTITYDTYFWGSGKKSDRPEKATSQLTKPLNTKIIYEIIGSIYDNPDLLEGGYE